MRGCADEPADSLRVARQPPKARARLSGKAGEIQSVEGGEPQDASRARLVVGTLLPMKDLKPGHQWKASHVSRRHLEIQCEGGGDDLEILVPDRNAER